MAAGTEHTRGMTKKRGSKVIAVAVAVALVLTGAPAAAGTGPTVHLAKPLRAE
jgi:DMSO reductase anchor subunit